MNASPEINEPPSKIDDEGATNGVDCQHQSGQSLFMTAPKIQKSVSTRGGKRLNAGSKSLQGGETVAVSFRILKTARDLLAQEAAAKGISLAFHIVEIVNQRKQQLP